MGEYVRYRGDSVKIGTAEALYYTSYHKFRELIRQGKLTRQEGNLLPTEYLDPDYGFLFRFPFPDEDNFEFGNIGQRKFDRGLVIQIERGQYFPHGSFPQLKTRHQVESNYQEGLESDVPIQNPNNVHECIWMELVFQKPVQTERSPILALVYRCPFSGNLWSIRDQDQTDFILRQIQEHYLDPATLEHLKLFWKEVINRIQSGYLGTQAQLNRVDVPYLF